MHAFFLHPPPAVVPAAHSSLLHRTLPLPLPRPSTPHSTSPYRHCSLAIQAHAFKFNVDLSSVDLKQVCDKRILHEHGDVLGAFVPVVLAVFACHRLKLKMAKDIQIAVSRSSIQLLLVGFVLKFVFEAEGLFMSALAVIFMVVIAGHTAGERAKELPYSHLVATLSLGIGSLGTLALMLLLKSFPISPRYIIPTTGYVVGSSMSMVGGTLNRLHHDIQLHQGQIEAALALGASPHQAVLRHVQRAVAQGMGPWVDSIKTAGLITLPGSMTGMLVVGSSPLEAVQMQIQVLYMLLGAAAVSSAISCFFGWHMLFTHTYQLQLNYSGK